MPYIYLITNNVTGEKYVGQTKDTPEKRFREHVADSKKRRCKNRPLYAAFNEFGVQNFSLKTLEACSPAMVDAHEVMWISRLDTYRNGYNATLGGGGRPKVTDEEVISLYKTICNMQETADELGICVDTVTKILRKNNIATLASPDVNRAKYGKGIVMLENGTLVKEFDSIRQGAAFLISIGVGGKSKSLGSIGGKIGECAAGKRKSAYGYTWQFVA